MTGIMLQKDSSAGCVRATGERGEREQERRKEQITGALERKVNPSP